MKKANDNDPDAVRPPDPPALLLALDDPRQRQRAGEQHHHQQGQRRGDFVGDHLGRRPHPAEQRPFVVRTPPAQENAHNAQAAHGRHKQHADIHIRKLQQGAVRDHAQDQHRRHQRQERRQQVQDLVGLCRERHLP